MKIKSWFSFYYSKNYLLLLLKMLFLKEIIIKIRIMLFKNKKKKALFYINFKKFILVTIFKPKIN